MNSFFHLLPPYQHLQTRQLDDMVQALCDPDDPTVWNRGNAGEGLGDFPWEEQVAELKGAA